MAENFDLTVPFDITSRIHEKLGDVILLLNNSSAILKVKENKFSIQELKNRLFDILDYLEV